MSIDRAKTISRGVRMAIRVAALSGAAACGAIALAASDANAEPTGDPKTDVQSTSGAIEAIKVGSTGRFSCISRGPAAPPEASADFETLLTTVPT